MPLNIPTTGVVAVRHRAPVVQQQPQGVQQPAPWGRAASAVRPILAVAVAVATMAVVAVTSVVVAVARRG